MKHLSIRNLPEDLSVALEKEKRRRGASLNQTIIELLSQSLGVGPQQVRENGLARLSGFWSEKEYREFEESTRIFEMIDEDVWR